MFPGEIGFLQTLEGIRNDFLNSVFEIITMLGEEVIVVLILSLIYFIFDKMLAKKIFFTIITSMNINGVVKNIARVSRPFANGEVTPVKADTATGYSFPSGHTQNFSTWSTAFAIQFKKWWGFVIAGVLIILVGFSRMYLGVHYPSDVIFGALFGIGTAIGMGFLFDKVKNKQLLYLIAAGVFIPFFVYFLISPNELYADFFKTYGMMLGLVFIEWFDNKFVNFDNTAPIWKKIIRFVVGVGLALAVKSLLKLTYESLTILPLVLVLDSIRYFLLVAISFGLWPLIFKKINL